MRYAADRLPLWPGVRGWVGVGLGVRCRGRSRGVVRDRDVAWGQGLDGG